MPSGPVHILVVEDDPQIAELLRARFEKEGFRVSQANSGTEAFSALQASPISLITLDLRLGHEDGLELARDIRANQNIPIIIVSGRDDEIDRVVGLEMGADDYITKPFSPREVVARVRAVLRRYEGSQQSHPLVASPLTSGQQYIFAGGSLNSLRREVLKPSGELLDLTTAEFNLIELFLRHPQQVMSRDDIMNRLKGHEWNPFDRSVDSAVARLRKKIEPDPDRPTYIKTVRNVGYVFAAEVRRS